MANRARILLCLILLSSASDRTPAPAPQTMSDSVQALTIHAEPSAANVLPPPTPSMVPNREADIRQLFAAKKYGDALAIIDSETKKSGRDAIDPDYRLWLVRQKWVLKTAQAWTFLEQQNCGMGLTLLEEIPTEFLPEVALKGIGYCRLMTRDWPEADANLTRYLKGQPQDAEAVQLLAKVKEAQGLYEEALDLTQSLEQIPTGSAPAIDLEPLRKSLLARQDESKSQLELESGFFRIHYQPDVSLDFVEKVVEVMQRTASKLNLDFGIDYPSHTVDVYFHSEERFGEITHSPSWAGGLYDGQIRLPIAEGAIWSESMARAIRHELAHALLAEMVGRRNLPTWFQEGFAQIAECETLCLHYDFAATTQKFFAIERFDESFMKLGGREAQVAYKQSLYMTILLHRHQGEANIKQMFSLLPGLESLSSPSIIEQSAWTFPLLHEYARRGWEGQISL